MIYLFLHSVSYTLKVERQRLEIYSTVLSCEKINVERHEDS